VFRHDVGVLRIAAIAVFASVCAAGCTSSVPDSPPVSSADVPSSVAPTTVISSPAPSLPTVPADVPTTGPNTRPGETPPVMPVAATKHTPAGARAFAAFFSGAYIRHYARQSCVGCASFANGMDADRRAGHRYIGGRITVTGIRLAQFGQEKDSTVAYVTFNELSYEELDSAGHFVGGDGAHRGERFETRLKWRGVWRVVGLAVAA
jgi:hypothetical protein